MNEASKWRLEIAHKVAPIIAANPNVQAVMLGGSAARGCADRYSDIEIGVFWATPPSDEQRIAHIAPSGGVLWTLDPYDASVEEWMEEWGLGGVKMDMRNLTVERMNRTVADVVDRCETSGYKQQTISAVLHGIPLYNAPMVEGWQAKARHYPDRLRVAMVEANLGIDPWWWVAMIAGRGDLPLVYQAFANAAKQMLAMLMGLNRIYHPGFKWMARTIAEMAIAPPNLAARLNDVFHDAPQTGIEQMQQLALAVYNLIDQHMPEVDTSAARRRFLSLRQPFDQPPAGVL